MKAGSPAPLITGYQPPLAVNQRWLPLLGFMSRDQLFAGLLIISCVNGLAGRIFVAVSELGWHALPAGFNVSAIAWLASVAGLRLCLQRGEGEHQIKAVDLVVAAIILGLTATPIVTLNWIALTLSSIYVARSSPAGSALQRGALICLALTAPMVWGPMLLNAYFEPFQRLDALFVSGLTGTERVGSLVRLADGSGYLIIAQGCSSFHNISLAILAWVTASQFAGGKGNMGQLGWFLLDCASVLAVNVVRIQAQYGSAGLVLTRLCVRARGQCRSN